MPKLGEERLRSLPEASGGGSLLVVEDLGVGQAGVGVDGGVHEGVAHLGSVVLAAADVATMSAPAATRWDAAQLLDVDVHQLTRATHLIRRMGWRVRRSRWSRRLKP